MPEKLQVTLTIGTEDRFEEYRKIFENCAVMENYSKNPDRDVLSEWLQPYLKDGHVIIANNSKGEPVGALVYAMDGMFGGLPYLELLGVRQDVRNHGIGGDLVDLFVELCRKDGFDKCFLCVSDFNGRAKKLYEKKGFKPLALIPDMLKKGIDEWMLMKTLD